MATLMDKRMAAAPQRVDITATGEVEKGQVSWFGTIMWMLRMIVLFNIVAGIVVYLVMK